MRICSHAASQPQIATVWGNARRHNPDRSKSLDRQRASCYLCRRISAFSDSATGTFEKKPRNSRLLKFASRHIPDSFELAYLPECIRRHIQLMSFVMIDRPMSKGVCCSERTSIIRTLTVSSDSPRCVVVKASNRIILMYVTPKKIVNYGKKIWQRLWCRCFRGEFSC